jgi:hypothetical protein
MIRRDHRKIEGLEWAREKLGPSPFGTPRGITPSQKAGLAYQRKVGKALGEIFEYCHESLWFEFQDKNGFGICQPDVVIETDGVVWIAEIKLSWCKEAATQLSDLYIPVVERALKVPCRGLIVCKTLRRTTPKSHVVEGLERALAREDILSIPILHWLGKGPL